MIGSSDEDKKPRIIRIQEIFVFILFRNEDKGCSDSRLNSQRKAKRKMGCEFKSRQFSSKSVLKQIEFPEMTQGPLKRIKTLVKFECKWGASRLSARFN